MLPHPSQCVGTKMMEPKANVVLGAHCNICNKTVGDLPMLNKDDLVSALKGGRDVRVMHIAAEGDHIWRLELVWG
jgi:hypothetical protein